MFKLVQTCGACPEQYDVYYEGKQVGYMRLRHGWFYAEHNGITVFEASPKGDGIFEDDEREYYLNLACQAIHNSMETAPQNRLYEIVQNV